MRGEMGEQRVAIRGEDQRSTWSPSEMAKIRTAEDLLRARFEVIRKRQLYDEEELKWRAAQYRYWTEVIGPLLSRMDRQMARIAARTPFVSYKEKILGWDGWVDEGA